MPIKKNATKVSKKRSPARSDEEKKLKYQNILDAAMDEFLEMGFTEAKLDIIAQKACVAKGTLYLYFSSKQALFEELIRTHISVPVNDLESMVQDDTLSVHQKIEGAIDSLYKALLSPSRAKVILLTIREAHRFPEIAEFYYHEVVKRGMVIIRYIADLAKEQGEACGDCLKQYPQLIFAPILLSVIWEGLFARFEPLDIKGMLEAHKALLLPIMTASQKTITAGEIS